MTDSADIACWIFRHAKPPVRADEERVRLSWPDLAGEFAAGAMEVAPGVWVKVLDWGDHIADGQMVHGALLAIRKLSPNWPGFGSSVNPSPDCGYTPRKPLAATEVWWCAACREFHGSNR